MKAIPLPASPVPAIDWRAELAALFSRHDAELEDLIRRQEAEKQELLVRVPAA